MTIDPMTLVVVSLFLINVTGLAMYIAAVLATNVDPLVTLRHE